VCVNSKTHFFLLASQIWVTRIYLSAAHVRNCTGLNLNALNIHKKITTHPLTLSHTHMQARTHARRREMGDVRAHGAIYTNILLHVYLTKYPTYRAALDLKPRRSGHSASTRATCLTRKYLAWCTVQLRCTTASQETCGIGRAHPPASRKGTHTLCRSSPGARAHTAPNEREPQTHGNFRNAC